MAAIAQIRLDTEGRTYYRRKFGEARTRSEARRCLKRRVSDMVYSQLVADAATQDAANDTGAGPGGHSGASLTSSAADLYPPVIGSSDQPQPEPAAGTLLARQPTPPIAASAPQPPAHPQRSRNRVLDNRGEPEGRRSGCTPEGRTRRKIDWSACPIH